MLFGDVQKAEDAPSMTFQVLFMTPFVLVGIGMLFAPLWNRLS